MNSSTGCQNEKLYFPSLTGLRAIAAFCVLFTHVERYRMMEGRAAVLSGPFNSFAGGLAVTFFFVLSGFLITSLLLKEKERTGTIQVAKFLKRRALRIWPLYYAVLTAGYLVSIFVLKDTDSDPWQNGLVLNVLMLSNVAFAFNMIPNMIIQMWSVGTEEQFYFIWPFLVRHTALHKLSKVFLAVIVCWGALDIFVHFAGDARMRALVFRTRIDCMAIGGLFALAVLQRDQLRGWMAPCYRLILHRLTGMAGLVIFVGLLAASRHWNNSFYQLYALLFGILIVRTSQQPVRWLESAPLKFLGKISYGIYLLHHFVIYLIFREMSFMLALPSPWGDLAVFVPACLFSVLTASLSYRLLESPFLRRKDVATTTKPLLSPG